MRASILAVFALLMPTLASAEWGLGTTVGNDTAGIYIPIQVGENLRLEPFISYYRTHSDSGAGEFTLRSNNLGLGVFRTVTVADQAEAYFGARASYLYTKADATGAPAETSDGYTIAPTIGGELFLFPQFSLAVEAYAYYTDIGGDGPVAVVGQTSYGTGSRLLARFFFE